MVVRNQYVTMLVALTRVLKRLDDARTDESCVTYTMIQPQPDAFQIHAYCVLS